MATKWTYLSNILPIADVLGFPMNVDLSGYSKNPRIRTYNVASQPD